MGHNRATCDSPLGSVAEGPCNRTGIKGPLSQGSFMACFDPHQLASTLQAMSEPMAMPHATKDLSERVELYPKNMVISASSYDGDALSFIGLV
ncbi:hypothetical protein AnigIFM63309_003576 [Aspergillus niger]|nr:hypothetical protein AnigIFM63309_003576 [Aspergillus niger]